MQGCRGKFSPEFNAFLCPWASKPQLIETVFDFFLIPASSHISLLELIVLSIGSQITFFFFSGGCDRDHIAFSASSDLFFSIICWAYAFLCSPHTFNVFIEVSLLPLCPC